MASDRGAERPRTGSGAHVWELPDCWVTSRDARGQSPLLLTASDDVIRAVRVLSAPRRPSTSVTERRARPRAASPATGEALAGGRLGGAYPRGIPASALPSGLAPPISAPSRGTITPCLFPDLRLQGQRGEGKCFEHPWEALKNGCDVNK